jgi:hypothetical protein
MFSELAPSLTDAIGFHLKSVREGYCWFANSNGILHNTIKRDFIYLT